MVTRLFRLTVPLAISALILSACSSDSSVEPSSLPLTPAPSLEVPDTDATQSVISACETWDVEALEWRALPEPSDTEVRDSNGNTVSVSRSPLPPADAERYNVGVEVCPDILLVIAHEGTSRYVSLEDWSWAEGPQFAPSGETSRIAAAGVSSGGPTWGFRDGLLVDDALFLSDAVIDITTECVRVDVHRVDLASVLEGSPESDVILETTPCVSYTDQRRAASAIRTHMGSALAYDDVSDSLFVSIGDLHLGASTIGQAAGIGLEGTLLDYEILGNPSAMVGAVVAIENPHDLASSSVFAKGLRNSLGMAMSGGPLWLSDHGPAGGDELNAIEQGGNYGWPLTSTGRPYDRSAWPSSSSALIAPWLDFQDAEVEGALAPLATWTPAIAPTEMGVYPVDGPIVHYQGRMLLATLRAQALHALELGSESITESTLGVGQRARNMTITGSGAVVLLTDSAELMMIEAAS